MQSGLPPERPALGDPPSPPCYQHAPARGPPLPAAADPAGPCPPPLPPPNPTHPPHLQVWLSYDANFGQPSESCLHPHKGVSGPQLWGWEFALTTFFSLVMVSAVFVPPGQGIAAPLAGGLALFAALATGEEAPAAGGSTRTALLDCGTFGF